MVGVINPNATTSLETQRELARNASFQLNPGDAWPAEATSSPPPGYTATETSTVAPSTPTFAPAATSSTAVLIPDHHHALSGGAIGGIVIGGAAVLVIAGFVIWHCGRQSRINNNNNSQPAMDVPPSYGPPAYGNVSYQPLSPTGKHMSSGAVSTAQPGPGFPGFPYAEQSQAHMAPFGAVPVTSTQQYFTQYPQQISPTMNPSNAFGSSPPPPPMQQQQQQQQMAENPRPAEADSERGRSPSPHSNQPQPVGGIEAFLARQQDRTSLSKTRPNSNVQGLEGGDGSGS